MVSDRKGAAMVKLAPSILSADLSRLAEQVALIEQGGADLVHVDVMDGAFVPNITFGGPVVKCLAGKTALPFDVHLMIEHPENRIPDFVTPQTEFICVHQEACVHLHRVIQQIKALGIKAGAAINPGTPVSMLEPVLGDLDMVLVMSVNPGFSGQKFIPSAMVKVSELDEIRKNKDNLKVFKGEIAGQYGSGNCLLINTASTHVDIKQLNIKDKLHLNIFAEF